MSEEDKDIPVEVLKVTPKAYLVRYLDSKKKEKESFIPNSAIVETDCGAAGDKGYIRVKAWLFAKLDPYTKGIQS
jgi:hypothetical protein